MATPVQVTVHPSQFPDALFQDLRQCLRLRQVSPKFLYLTHAQTARWLELHAACSPSRHDPACIATYERAFAEAAPACDSETVNVVGLGCGGGQKDARLLALLRAAGHTLAYTPCDASLAMVLVAREAALAAAPLMACMPLVCDLQTVADMPDVLGRVTLSDAVRCMTFFGMIPNFEPDFILARLASWLQPRDLLLFSAPLAPGSDYAAGVSGIMAQYDNTLTRDWLFTFLGDLGASRQDGQFRFAVEDDPAGSGLKRIVATFEFNRPTVLSCPGEQFRFEIGDRLRLFFSYRYTPILALALLERHGLRVTQQWTAPSGEEAVFLCRPG